MNDDTAVADNTNAKKAKAKKSTAEKLLSLKQVYLKNIQLDVITPCFLVNGDKSPDFKMDLDMTNAIYGDTHVALELKVNISVKTDKPIFDLKIVQGGLFEIDGYDEKEKAEIVHTFCPSMVFPYLKQVVASTSAQAGFIPIQLTHVDFHAKFQEAIAKSKSKANSK